MNYYYWPIYIASVVVTWLSFVMFDNRLMSGWLAVYGHNMHALIWIATPLFDDRSMSYISLTYGSWLSLNDNVWILHSRDARERPCCCTCVLHTILECTNSSLSHLWLETRVFNREISKFGHGLFHHWRSNSNTSQICPFRWNTLTTYISRS